MIPPRALMLACAACGVAGGMVGALVALSVRPAAAQEGRAAVELGPADALLLAAPPGAASDAKPLALRNGAGRLSWGSEPGSRLFSIGLVHVDRILKGIIQSDRFVADRMKFDERAREAREDFERRFKAFEEKYPNPDPKSPDFEQVQREFAALQNEAQVWAARIQDIQSRMAAEQVEKAYKEMISAVEVVGDRRSVDIVYRFLPASKPFESLSLPDAMLQVQSRTMLRYPDSIDLTEDVVRELGLKEP
jgi:hypothetical protein